MLGDGGKRGDGPSLPSGRIEGRKKVEEEVRKEEGSRSLSFSSPVRERRWSSVVATVSEEGKRF